ncbi:hypothetical protein PTSG_02161 [Salpingoeca rosetta]|uniref:Coiled-coil alpha-helical rod protein 1 n=1 Tax=Salpingoeca rosetta (strain ATCC 50818 / BSB-021) TaxID=946362 RepID=F2U1D8_SALR5|nr:uncharacterized protein PTSG_02161 [Salpingoeca rosetta]EGD81440.1 hypothetical protein PTSG_02161 [Salpingoeca rosetta]|eukprot:XP_004996644.1 hypothetical protein PTSG_02161 [Salpingoeca rosetta]
MAMLQLRLVETQRQLRELQMYYRGFHPYGPPCSTPNTSAKTTATTERELAHTQQENVQLKRKLGALEAILQLQEAELARGVDASSQDRDDNDDDDGDGDNETHPGSAAQRVLQRWRDEVLRHMLHANSMTLRLEDQRRERHAEICSIKKLLDQEQHKRKLAELQLEAKDADVVRLQQQLQDLQHDTDAATAKAAAAEENMHECKERANTIARAAKRVTKDMMAKLEQTHKALDKLGLLSYRLKFAEGRVATISHFLKSKRGHPGAKTHERCDEAAAECAQTESVDEEPNASLPHRAPADMDWVGRLEAEVERVTAERDALRRENESLAHSFDQRVMQFKQACDERTTALEQQLAEANASAQSMQTQIQRLAAEIKDARLQCEQKQREVEASQRESRRSVEEKQHEHEMAMQQMSGAHKRREEELMSTIAALEQDAAATAVTIKQLERRLAHDKAQRHEQHEQQMASLEGRIAQLTDALQQVTQERNMLSARVRGRATAVAHDPWQQQQQQQQEESQQWSQRECRGPDDVQRPKMQQRTACVGDDEDTGGGGGDDVREGGHSCAQQSTLNSDLEAEIDALMHELLS